MKEKKSNRWIFDGEWSRKSFLGMKTQLTVVLISSNTYYLRFCSVKVDIVFIPTHRLVTTLLVGFTVIGGDLPRKESDVGGGLATMPKILRKTGEIGIDERG